ncbi:MAG: FecR family protein [Caulobacter sp.]|nr:FecR family protein [Caulobacter sp.]
MSGDAVETPPSQAAANWLARLNTTTVSAKTMAEFRQWRTHPDNHDAFREIADVWTKAGEASDQPGVQAALAAALAAPKPRRQMGLRAGFGVATAALAASLCSYFVWTALAAPVYDTQVGEQRLVKLSDGSSVRLDTNTRLTVRYTGAKRQIRLDRGQAFFDVAHDPARPFLVTTDQATVRAVGTRFSVREDGRDTRVTLVQGRVEVRQGAVAPHYLSPGEQIVASTSLGPVSKVDSEVATSWTTGRLVFHVVPLRQAVAEINRYSAKPVTLDPAYNGAATVSGAFDNTNAEAMISAVAELRDLTVERQADGSILLRQRPGV